MPEIERLNTIGEYNPPQKTPRPGLGVDWFAYKSALFAPHISMLSQLEQNRLLTALECSLHDTIYCLGLSICGTLIGVPRTLGRLPLLYIVAQSQNDQ